MLKSNGLQNNVVNIYWRVCSMAEEGKYMVCNNEKVNDVKRNTNLKQLQKGSINST